MDYSIIIIYYNQYDIIELLLAALTAQNYEKDKFEVIVVDDGSEKSIKESVNKFKDKIILHYYPRQHSGNRSSNRNYGAKYAKGKNLIFLDADILPPKDMITLFKNEMRHDDELISAGFRIDIFEYEKKQISEFLATDQFTMINNIPGILDGRYTPERYKQETGMYYLGGWQILYSACFSISKYNFDLIGGFDIEFGTRWGNEDVELGFRLWKAGKKIKMNHNLCVYHLIGTRNRTERNKDFSNNCKLLLAKHQHWLIELYIKETIIWSNEHIRLQRKIINQEGIIHSIKNVRLLMNQLPWDTILFGIDDQYLINSKKIVKAFIPESKISSPKIDNILGIMSDYQDKTFSCSVISDKYRDVSIGLFFCQIKEACRISDKVLLIDEKGNIKKQITVPKFILFNLSNYFHFFKTQYYFLRLALTASNKGYIVGINIDIDLFKALDFNQLYMQPDENKCDLLTEFRDHSLNLIEDDIPCFMDSLNVDSERSLRRRILWEEEELLTFSARKNKCLSSYREIFSKRKQDFEDSEHKKTFMPIGIDIDLLNKYNNMCPPKEEIEFLWADFTVNNSTNLLEIVKIFKLLKLKLKIVLFGDKIEYKDNFIYNDSLNELVRRKIDLVYEKQNDYLKKIIDVIKNTDNIVMYTSVNKEEDYLAALADSDVYINLNSVGELSPFVLYSVAMGKKPFLLDNGFYNDYVSAETSIVIKVKKDITYLDDILIDSPETVRAGQKAEILRPELLSLTEQILTIVNDPDLVKINENLREKFCEAFNWNSIFENLEKYWSNNSVSKGDNI